MSKDTCLFLCAHKRIYSCVMWMKGIVSTSTVKILSGLADIIEGNCKTFVSVKGSGHPVVAFAVSDAGSCRHSFTFLGISCVRSIGE